MEASGGPFGRFPGQATAVQYMVLWGSKSPLKNHLHCFRRVYRDLFEPLVSFSRDFAKFLLPG